MSSAAMRDDQRHGRRGLRLFRRGRPALQHLQGRQRDLGDQPGPPRRKGLQRRDARGAWRWPSRRGARPAAISTSARSTGTLDPSGIVKGWAIRNAAALVARSGARDYFVDAGGDIQSAGHNADGNPWRVGIRNPFDQAEIIKVVDPRGKGVATSGTYVRGQHIYDPHARRTRPSRRSSALTVIGPMCSRPTVSPPPPSPWAADGISFIAAVAGPRGLCRRPQRPRDDDQRLRRLLHAMIKIIDRFLDHTTMYRLVLWHLIALHRRRAGAQLLRAGALRPGGDRLFDGADAGGVLGHQPRLRARLPRAAEPGVRSTSPRSSSRSSSSPVELTDLHGIGALVFASVWAMASKYIFAVGASTSSIRRPSASCLPALLLGQPATWWVGGNLPLLPVVFIGGVLIVRKLQRFDLIVTFLGVVFATILATTAPSQYAMAISETLKSLADLLLRLRHADRTADRADDAVAAARLRRAGRLPVRAQRPYRLVLFHARAGAASSAISSPGRSAPRAASS